MTEAMSERVWQAEVCKLAHLLGWRHVYHTHDSRRSQAGFPDLVLVRDRVVYLELKSETGTVANAQRDWLGALLDADAEAYLVRPRHLDDLAKALAYRPGTRKLDPHRARARDAIGRLRADTAVEIGRSPP